MKGADKLAGVLTLEHQRIPPWHGVIFARAAGARQTFNSHRLEPNEAEGLDSTVGEHGGSAAEQHPARFPSEMRPQADNIRGPEISQAFNEPSGTRLWLWALDNLQLRGGSPCQHLGAVRFDSTARDQQRTPTMAFEFTDDIDGQQPALVRIPARDFAEHDAIAGTAAKLGHRFPIGPFELLWWEPIGNHQWVHAQAPHPVSHVPTHGRDHCGLRQPSPIDAIKPARIVRVPENGGPVAQPGAAEQPVEVQNGTGCLPFLGQNK
jgi:hypothetical protein